MVNVGVVGHTGRLGKPLMEILSKHPSTKVVYTESRTAGSNGNLSYADVVLLALPRGESDQYLGKLENKRVIDLSIDHRYADGWIYGMPALNYNDIRSADRVANPGCYATSIILGLAPIAGHVSDVSIASTSGVSGAGRKPTGEDNFRVYSDDRGREHPQIIEIEKTLGITDVQFVPQVIENADRGIVSTIFCKYGGDIKTEDLRQLYDRFFGLDHFVRVKDTIQTADVVGTNYCDIKITAHCDRLVVVSALDNIMKGGAGQAVQNMNIMFGLDPGYGLIQADSCD